MQARSRPTSIKLCKVTRGQREQDIGNLHIIDYWLARACKSLISHAKLSSQPRIGRYDYRPREINILTGEWRYLDGEEEREGLYR